MTLAGSSVILLDPVLMCLPLFWKSYNSSAFGSRSMNENPAYLPLLPIQSASTATNWLEYFSRIIHSHAVLAPPHYCITIGIVSQLGSFINRLATFLRCVSQFRLLFTFLSHRQLLILSWSTRPSSQLFRRGFSDLIHDIYSLLCTLITTRRFLIRW